MITFETAAWSGTRKKLLLAGLITAMMGAGIRRSSDARAAAAPATVPASNSSGPLTPEQKREQKVELLLDYLEKDYAKKAVAPYWVSRSMGVISLARSPRPTATTKLLDILEKDKHDVVRLLAFQAVLARVDQLDAKSHTRWMAATTALAEKGAFNGALRITLLDVLASAPPTQKSRRIWNQLYTDVSAWEPQDIPVLDALGRTLTAWKSGAMAQDLIKQLADPNSCVRAEYVLHAAGCNTKLARDHLNPEVFNPTSTSRVHPSSSELWRTVQQEVSTWFQGDRANWKEITQVPEETRKQLKPMYVAAPIPRDQIDYDDKFWTADLELGMADLDQFDVVFTVDATGSMGDVLTWLRRDMARVMKAMNVLCKEPPKIGVVFYRDQGDVFVTKSLPLTTRLADLEPGLLQMTADGGGDIPEAIKEALDVTMNKMNWSTARRKNGGRIAILIGDAPPKPGTEEACAEIAKKGAEKGIKLYACKVTTVEGHNDLAVFDALATAGGGSTVAVTFGRLSFNRFIDLATKREIPLQTIDRPEAQLIVAPAGADQAPGEKILTHVLADAINRQYRDRVEPLAQTLLAYAQLKSEPEKRLVFAANTPPLALTKFNSQKK
jgi:Mg-chelatase subunit ChlD